MRHIFKRRFVPIPAFATVVATMTLAACGGGGGGVASATPATTPITTPAPTPTPTPAPTPTPTPSGIVAKVWETDGDQTKLLAAQSDVTFNTTAPTGTIVTVDATQTYQSMVGFGGALTDAASYVIRHDMSASQREALMADLFGSTGIGLSFLRLTVGASDFSASHYTYDDVASGAIDPGLANFSIDPAKVDVVPLAVQALALNSRLSFMASPWSAPAWMKSTGSLYKGTLNPSAYAPYADYLSRYVKAMGAAGVPISYMTMQNEPMYEPADYPGMSVPAAVQATFIGQYLGPKFVADGVTAKILAYDHNWDLPGYPSTVLADATANSFIGGVAWHCYAGDVAAQSTVRSAYPSKDVFLTECSGSVGSSFAGDLVWNARNLVIGAPRNWARSVLLWNLALDENKGPHFNPHGPYVGACCRGIVTVNSATGAVTKNVEYYILGHASKFVRPGALRIASDNAGGIETVAFKNSDDGSIVLIALNGNAVGSTFAVKSAGSAFSYTLPAGSVATFVWKP